MSSLDFLKSIDTKIEEEKKQKRGFSKLNEDFKKTVKNTLGDNSLAETLGNVPQSAVQFGKDITAPFLSPIDTATTIAKLGSGLVQLAIPGEQGNEELARAVGSYYADRYGGVENALKTLREDPVGLVSDVALTLTGVGAGIKGAGTVGKLENIAQAGKQIQKSGIKIDPATPVFSGAISGMGKLNTCLLYTSPSPRDG